MTLDAFRAYSDERSVAAVQIEDAEALNHLDDICAVDDVDMLFIGPTDLSQSMNVALDSAVLEEAIQKIIDAGRAADIAIGLFVGDPATIPDWINRGVSLFVCGSDQSMLRRSAIGLKAALG